MAFSVDGLRINDVDWYDVWWRGVGVDGITLQAKVYDGYDHDLMHLPKLALVQRLEHEELNTFLDSTQLY